MGVGGGLLERELSGSAVGRECVDIGGMRPAGAARRFLAQPVVLPLRSATRDRRSAGYRVINVGFRVARTLTPPPPGDAARAYEVAAERLSRSQRAARRRWNRAGGIYAAAITVAVSVPWEGRMVTVAATCGLRRPEDRDCPIHGIPTPAPTDSAAISR